MVLLKGKRIRRANEFLGSPFYVCVEEFRDFYPDLVF